jgi:drug/metabolite transporter (DMT)-like permease
MNHRLFPVIVISILWALSFNLCKKITKNNNILCLVLIKLIIMGIIGYLIYLSNQKLKNEIFNLDKRTFIILFLIGLFEVIASYLYFISLENNDATWSVPMIEAGVILVSALISLYLFKEKLTFKRILGIFTILIGIYLVNLS